MKRKVKVAAESAGGVKPTAVLTNRPAPWSGNEMRRKVCGFRCSHSFAGNVCSFPCFYSVGLYCFFLLLWPSEAGLSTYATSPQSCIYAAIWSSEPALRSSNTLCLLFPSHPPPLRFCQLWPLMCWVSRVQEKQLPGDLSLFSAALLRLPLPASFMLLCVNPEMFQTMQMLPSAVTFLWHFSTPWRKLVGRWAVKMLCH